MSARSHILLAERQEGIVTHEQLTGLGWSRHRIQGDLGHWLHPRHHGVFSVGMRRVTPRGACWAAVLATGREAVLSHRSAAAFWGLIDSFPAEPEVTVAQSRRPRPGIRLYRRALPPDEVIDVKKLRMTTVARTILDLAGTQPQREVEKVTSEAEYQRLWDPYSLPQFIENHKGCKGISLLKTMLAEGAITITKSELERRFLAFLRRCRLPLPETNVPMALNGRRIKPDCVWRGQRLIIELDGRAAHQTTSRFHDDRLRDRKLDLAKWTVWRVTARHLDDELARDLRAKLC